MLRITLSRLGAPEHAIDLRDRTLRIGRGAGNEVLLQDPDKTVSRTHGEVRREAAGWVFIDNDSQNGSWVEGRRVDRVVLREGVTITFGDYELTCHEIEGHEGVSARAPAPPAADLGRDGTSSDEQTRLAHDVAPAAAPDKVDLHQMPTVMVPALPASDETASTLPLPGAWHVARPVGAAGAPPSAPEAGPDAAGGEDEEDARTIVVSSDTEPSAGEPRPASSWHDTGGQPTIVVAVGQQPVPSPQGEEDDDAATIVVPSFTPPAAPPAVPPTAGRQTPVPVFPIQPALELDSTQEVPGDLSELFQRPSAAEPVAPVTSGRPATDPPGAVPPARVSPEAEDVATVLIPGRPSTGQLATPPRSSGEVPAVPPPVPPAPGSGTWRTFTPPSPIPVPASTAAPSLDAPPPAERSPATSTAASRALDPPLGSPLPPPRLPAVEVPPAAVPVAQPPEARPVAAAAPAVAAGVPRASRPFAPAVLVWGAAWLVLFGLIGAVAWLWFSSRSEPAQSPATEVPGASAPAQATSPTPSVEAPAAVPSTVPSSSAAETGGTAVPAAIAPLAPATPASPQESAGASAPVPAPAPSAAPSGTPPTAPEVWVDRPPPAPPANVPRRPGERTPEYRQRVADIERQYTEGRNALASGRAGEARDLLRAVAAAAPAYKDVDGLLRDAEAAVQREAAAAIASAEKLEHAADYEKALAGYRRAGQLGAPADRVSAGVQRVQQQMRAAGEKAFADARQFDSLGRNADAARLYEIAVRYLPDGDPRRAQARQRLEVLGVKRP